MDASDDRDLDRRLEDAAAPEAASVERVVAGALGTTRTRRTRVGRLAVLAGAAGAAAIVVALRWPPRASPAEPIRMRNVGEVILVDYPDGSRAIIGPARPASELFAGFDYVLFEGERP